LNPFIRPRIQQHETKAQRRALQLDIAWIGKGRPGTPRRPESRSQARRQARTGPVEAGPLQGMPITRMMVQGDEPEDQETAGRQTGSTKKARPNNGKQPGRYYRSRRCRAWPMSGCCRHRTHRHRRRQKTSRPSFHWQTGYRRRGKPKWHQRGDDEARQVGDEQKCDVFRPAISAPGRMIKRRTATAPDIHHENMLQAERPAKRGVRQDLVDRNGMSVLWSWTSPHVAGPSGARSRRDKAGVPRLSPKTWPPRSCTCGIRTCVGSQDGIRAGRPVSPEKINGELEV